MSLTKRKSQEATGNEKIKIKTEAKKELNGKKGEKERRKEQSSHLFSLSNQKQH